MTLIEQMMTPCARLIGVETPDGLGGRQVNWTVGEGFAAALLERRAQPATEGQRSASGSKFAVVTPGDVALEYHEVFRRASDGRTFRVTGPTILAPGCAASRLGVAECEGWVLP